MGQRIRAVEWALRALALSALLTAITAAGQGTCTFTDESGKVVTLPNCGIPAPGAPGSTPSAPSSSAPAAAKNFPYPGESTSGGSAGGASSGSSGLPAAPGSGTTRGTTPGIAETPAKTQAPANAPSSGSNGNPASSGSSTVPAGQRFPFPGEDSSGSAARPGGLQDAGSSGSSSSSSQGSSSSSSSSDSSSSNSSSDPDDNGVGPLAGDNDAAARAAAKRHRERLPAAPPAQSDSDREQEDVRVAAFYQNDEDYKGAYERSRDAVSLADDDAAAHLALAEAARKLGKLDEAEANYKRCLSLDPVPKVRKAAEKALKEMEGAQ